MDKEEIIKKHWPKPSQSDSITAWKEAIGKMMDEWGSCIVELCQTNMGGFEKSTYSANNFYEYLISITISKSNQ